MNALVVYDSVYGNTQQVARAVSDVLASRANTRLVRVSEAAGLDLAGIDLLMLGSPTHGWRPTPAMRDLLDRLPEGSLRNLPAAAFDTRLRGIRLLTGSAARSLAKTIERMGARLILPPESFLVVRSEGPLAEGELTRATEWARALIDSAAGLGEA